MNTFSVRRCRNLVVCPVKNFERYTAVTKSIRITLGQGFLFRVTKGNNVTKEPFTTSAVHGRFGKSSISIKFKLMMVKLLTALVVAAP